MHSLVAFILRQPARPVIRFKGFARSPAAARPNAWGAAFYPDASHMLFKELREGETSKLAAYLARADLASSLFVLQAQRLPKGGKQLSNVGPFQRELRGRSYVFALGGNLQLRPSEDKQRFQPVGTTAAEGALCRLLSAMEDRGIQNWSTETFGWLRSRFAALGGLGTYSCVLSEGEHLFCYRGEHDPRGLCFRRGADDAIEYDDEDFHVQAAPLAGRRNSGYVVARPAREGQPGWAPIEPGELVVFRAGELVFFSAPRSEPRPRAASSPNRA